MKNLNFDLEQAITLQKNNRINELVKYFKENIIPIENTINYCLYKEGEPVIISTAVLKNNFLNKLNVKELNTKFDERVDFKSAEDLGLKQQKKCKTDPKLVKENEQLKERIKQLEQELSQYQIQQAGTEDDMSVFMTIEKTKEPKKRGRKSKKDN